jgi:predicted RNA-binding protein with PUA-like domain
MQYWLLKSEPSTWSWDDQVKKGIDHWDGVRNYQAQNNMKQMKVGDYAFFYHSVKEKQVVGIVEIVKEAYPDPTDTNDRFIVVDIKPVKPLPQPVTLAQIKNKPELQNLALIRQSRLSVMPIDLKSWEIICSLGGL